MENDNNQGRMEDLHSFFSDLIIDKAEKLDIKTAKTIIQNYVKIDREGGIEFNEEFEKLTNGKKIGVYLVAKKVSAMLGFIPSEKASQKDISKETTIAIGSVKNMLGTQLSNFVTNEKGYFMINYKLKKFLDQLEGKQNEK
ncbi:hypothetical protein COT72_04990 [archaeon CG10_big_fil_rev_8_21_14_0_10_43_11]|nr:MAG: hypothetical protein COT72_04990 [archaeon CG10_big_fil_rev_8_21_14_0_10_43_11]